MHILKILIIYTLLLFSFDISSEELSANCAMQNNEISSLDYSICEEDISFKVLYELFPDIWEETLFEIYEFDHLGKLKDDPTIIGNPQTLRISLIFQEIFKVFFDATMSIVFIIIIYYSFVGLLKTIEDGEFLGRDWNTVSVIKSGSLTFLLLLPIGGIFVVQLIALALTTLGIALANYMYGFYLSTLESVGYTHISSEETDMNSVEGHNKFYSYLYVKNLTNIELCRQTSTQYQIQKSGSIIDSNVFNDENIYQCLAQPVDTVRINKETANEGENFTSTGESFINYNFVEYQKNNSEKITKIANGITFGSLNQNSCNENYTSSFSCGEINVVVPNIDDNKLISYFLKNDFNIFMRSTINSLDLNNPNSNKTVIENRWFELRIRVEEDLKRYINDYEDSFVKTGLDRKYILAKRIIESNDDSHFKKLSYVYHQIIQNYFLIGFAELESESSIEMSGHYRYGSLKVKKEMKVSENSKTTNFISYYQQIVDFSKLVQEYQCLVNDEGLDKSQLFLNKLSGEFNNASSNRCIDYENNRVLGLNGNIKFDRESKLAKLADLEKLIIEEHNKLAEIIYKNKTIVENSFVKSIKNSSLNSMLKELRKKGWVTFASNLIALNSEANSVNNLKMKLINSLSFSSPAFSRSMISNNILDTNNDISTQYENYINRADVMSNFKTSSEDLSNYVDISKWSSDVFSGLDNPFNDGDVAFSDYIRLLTKPFSVLKESVGIKDDAYLIDETKNLNELCSANIAECPVPKINPFIQLNNVGHYFIQVSLSYYSMAIMISVPLKINKKLYAEKAFEKEQKGLLGGGNVDQKESKSKKILRGLLGFFSEIINILSFLMFFMLAIGIFLAYAIPIIPFLYFTVAFLSWFLLVIQIIFVSPIWSAYLLGYQENKREVKKFAYDYGLQIVLKPVFMVMSLIFIWSFYTAIIFFINLTIFPLLSQMSMEGEIMSVISNIVLAFILTYVLFVITKRIFDIFETLYTKIFSALGIDADSADTSDTRSLSEGGNIVQGLIGFHIYQQLQGKMSGINFGNSYKNIKRQSQKFAQNRMQLLDYLSKTGMYNNKKLKNETDVLNAYYKEIQKNPGEYGDFTFDYGNKITNKRQRLKK